MELLKFENDKKYDVVSLGRVGVDLYAEQVNCPMEDVLTFGKHIGGSPANITVGLAKLGMKTGFIGRIADDGFARYILKYFKDATIDTSGIVLDRSGANTQVAVSEILGPEKANIIFYRDNIADLQLKPSDIREEYIANAKILNISGTALAASTSREAVFVAIEYAIKNNVTIFMDIDYRNFNWKSVDETAVYYSLAAEKCDVLLGTREEFNIVEAIVDPGNSDDKKTAQRLIEKRAKIVLIKHGKEGSIAFTKDGGVYEGVVFPAKIINTFGAGDSYAASFIYGLLNGYNVKESMDLGAAASSIVISRNDCSDAMPVLAEVKAQVKEYYNNK